MLRLATVTTAALVTFAQAQPSFVQAAGPQLTLNGQPFQFTGSNNYYLMYSPPSVVDTIFQTAAANGFTVMRTWGWSDTGTTSGSLSVTSPPNGVYFQYWNNTSAPVFNDGSSGLINLDYVIYSASQAGIKLIIPFTNNWTDFGGMDQYVLWRGLKTHDAFYTDPTIQSWYQAYIAHLLTRVNTFTGIAYKDDPTILGWELANEPRCTGSGYFPTSRACSTATLTNWAGETATFIKSIDPNHLVSAGDEGWYCTSPGSSDSAVNCTQGVDTVALAQAPGIDWMSFHLYPLYWNQTVDWGTQWVTSHFANASAIGKPAVMGEFGYDAGSGRLAAYKNWTDALIAAQGSGGLFWWLTQQSNFDSLDVACPNAVCSLMSNLEQQLIAGQTLSLPPIADDSEVRTTYQTPAAIAQPVNAIAYNGAAIDPTTISLGPPAAGNGQQLTYTTSFGSFAVQPDWSVQFAPAPGYAGKTSAPYTVADSNGLVSNSALLRVTVTSEPGQPYTLYSFEEGADGWNAASFQSNAGSTAVSTDWASDGSQSLEITATGGGWFGVSFSPAQNWKGRTQLIYRIETLAQPTSAAAVIQVGSSYLWCQSDFGYVPANTTTGVTIDLTNMGCGVPDLSQVQSLFIYFSANGTYYLDQVQIQ